MGIVGLKDNRSGLLLAAAVFFLLNTTGCEGDGEVTLVPTTPETRSIAAGDTVTFTAANTTVSATDNSFGPGQAVDVSVVLDPANLPGTTRAGAYWEKHASISLVDVDNSGTFILEPLTVTIPLRNDGTGNTSLKLFQFDPVMQAWVITPQFASISDSGNRATFAVTNFGTYGLFRTMSLKVDAVSTRYTGKAPLSVSLQAHILGGTPPYSTVWYFGDDSTPEAGTSVSHLYEDPFTYQATVTVIDATGATVTDFANIEAH